MPKSLPANFLSLSGVGITYPHNHEGLVAISNLDMEVSEKEMLSVVGPSGCGKTTLLRLIAGLVAPTEGSVIVGEKEPGAFRDAEGIGFMFQKPLLFPWRTVLENLFLPVEIRRGAAGDSDLARARELLSTMALSGFEEAFPSQLSGGMLQRAALARALMLKPKLLLLDEPFSALDEITREQLWFDFYRVWRSQDMTLVLVTHSVREAVFFGDRVMIMSQRPGRIVGSIPVPLPRRRGRETTTDVMFIETCKNVRERL